MTGLYKCNDNKCPKYKYCKRYIDEDGWNVNFKNMFKNKGFKCFIYQEREIYESRKKECKTESEK